MADIKTPTQPRNDAKDRADSGPYTRLVAKLVLIPTVPMLLLSVAALALFYIAPTRFGNLIARLPGETFIRSALFFAPATLFAVVVLAALYALERPTVDVARTQPHRKLDQAVSIEAVKRPRSYTRQTAKLSLILALPALLFSTAVWGLSFVSPDRFERMITPLPGDQYLRHLIPIAPISLFIIVLLAAFYAFYGGFRAREVIRTSSVRPIRLAVGIVLISAIPTLLFSLAGLGLFYLSPTRFERLLDRLPYDAFVRLALVFAPAVLFAVVLLAFLYLFKRRVVKATQPIAARITRRTRINFHGLRSLVALWVLVGGLIFTAVIGFGLLGVVTYLVLLK